MYLFVIISSILTFVHYPQSDSSTPTDIGYKKGIIIIENDTLRGSIQIKIDSDHCVLKSGNSYKMITAKELTLAIVADSKYVGVSAKDTPRLFELLMNRNGVMVLYREGFRYDPKDPETTPPFFIYKKNKLEPVLKDKDLLQAFGDDDKWMDYHIKTESLDLTSREDVIKAFKYYESQKIF